ncbi:MAG TPA: outer membrane beta-barrel protein [Gemmatimonadaceae bacterium]|nr:outer membrane beta-barrel protein [Gemmatimonadaceae bacterium]
MTRRIAFTAAAALLSLTLAPAADAQAQVMPHFGISAGASIPQSSFGDGVNTGYNLNGMINVGVPLSPLGFRGEVGWNRFDLSGNNASGNVRMVNGAVNVVLAPSTVMSAKPYFIAGLGAYNVKTSVSGSGGILGGSAFSSSSSDTRLGFNGGIGFAFGLGPVGTLLEARYVSVNGSNGGSSLSFVPISFGISF